MSSCNGVPTIWAIKPTRTAGCADMTSDHTKLAVSPDKPITCAIETSCNARRGRRALRQYPGLPDRPAADPGDVYGVAEVIVVLGFGEPMRMARRLAGCFAPSAAVALHRHLGGTGRPGGRRDGGVQACSRDTGTRHPLTPGCASHFRSIPAGHPIQMWFVGQRQSRGTAMVHWAGRRRPHVQPNFRSRARAVSHARHGRGKKIL